MKFKLLIFFLIFQVISFAQDRIPIKGRLIYRNVNVVAANVVNITAQINTITDDLLQTVVFTEPKLEVYLDLI